uniref:Fc receptor, IgE, high affinity I, gamma polypeptide like n=1 Tax=Amphiprion percula TaxID=161767 RepID=A0A3P8U0P8_AMPPE
MIYDFLGNMSLCYILDGILILYGIILTVLYCRLRVRCTMVNVKNVFCVLQGLTSHSADTYETIKMDKRPII